jgi:hypothetical protein
MRSEVGPEEGRDGGERDGGGEDVCFGGIVILRLGVGFERLAFEPGYGACFEVFIRAVLERVTDESEANKVVRVRTQDGGGEIVCVAAQAGGGRVGGDEGDGLEVLGEGLVVFGFAYVVLFEGDETECEDGIKEGFGLKSDCLWA